MKVTIIIPSFKRPFDLQRCLEGVARQTRPADEVLVVIREDDTETSNVVSRLQPKIPVLRIVLITEPGVIAALNCGLDNAMGDLLVFTDDDAEPELDWLARVETSFDDASIGAVGGRDWLQLPDEPGLFRPAPVSRVGILTWYGGQRGNHHCPLRGHTRKVMFLKGVNMAFRRHALGSYRIDTTLHGSGAQAGYELDLCLQTREAGFDVLFDDRILVKHYASPRPGGEDRAQLSGFLFPDISFNNHYLIAKRFGLSRALAYFCNERLLGSRPMPGLLACLKWYFRGDRHALRRLVQASRSGLAGFRAGRHARAMARQDRAKLKLDLSNSKTVEVQALLHRTRGR
jgi:glycosyltransferase involved in cell wall biosynthesis